MFQPCNSAKVRYAPIATQFRSAPKWRDVPEGDIEIVFDYRVAACPAFMITFCSLRGDKQGNNVDA
jgi:hypothetical protein